MLCTSQTRGNNEAKIVVSSPPKIIELDNHGVQREEIVATELFCLKLNVPAGFPKIKQFENHVPRIKVWS